MMVIERREVVFAALLLSGVTVALGAEGWTRGSPCEVSHKHQLHLLFVEQNLISAMFLHLLFFFFFFLLLLLCFPPLSGAGQVNLTYCVL